ncbi:MAG: ParA family protein [Patescibacteria group bacterium]|nr:ParA family protein [Patescibacteria group bacterium]MDD5490226.1 ParA family protein [Patescibacteria group bacterium]
MAQVIAVVNQKGGVGKTTTAMNLGAYLALLGKFVLLIDLDPQANATSGLGVNHRELQQGIYNVLLGEVKIRDIILPTNQEGYRLAPSTMDLAGANIELVNLEEREYRLAHALEEVRGSFDYIIIDCPPSLGLLTVNALTAADSVIIPVQAEYYALEGLGQLLETIGLVKENLNPKLEVLGALLTMFDSRNRLANDVFSELYQYFPNKIFRSVIPRSVRLAEAPSHGATILNYDSGSKAAKCYEKFAKELLEIMEQY